MLPTAMAASIKSRLLALSCFVFAIVDSLVAASAPIVHINETRITGRTTATRSDNGNLVAEFLGIRYAAKPIRFAPATPYVLPPHPVDATRYGPVCIQE